MSQSDRALENLDVSILVVSCDAYQDLWGIFFRCLFSYWPDCPFPIYLGSNFRRYPDERVRTIQIGSDVDYSSNLLKMLARIPSEWVVLWIEDRPPASSIETCRVLQLIALAQSRG